MMTRPPPGRAGPRPWSAGGTTRRGWPRPPGRRGPGPAGGSPRPTPRGPLEGPPPGGSAGARKPIGTSTCRPQNRSAPDQCGSDWPRSRARSPETAPRIASRSAEVAESAQRASSTSGQRAAVVGRGRPSRTRLSRVGRIAAPPGNSAENGSGVIARARATGSPVGGTPKLGRRCPARYQASPRFSNSSTPSAGKTARRTRSSPASQKTQA